MMPAFVTLLLSLLLVSCTRLSPIGALPGAATVIAEAPKTPGAGGDGEGIAGAEIFVGGFFFSNGVGYYANAAGHYCALVSFDAYRAAGGPHDVESVTHVGSIPRSFVSDGPCYVAPPAYHLEKFFLAEKTVYYQRDDGNVCKFEYYAQYLAAGGTSDVTNLKKVAERPSPAKVDSQCIGAPVGNVDGQNGETITGWALDPNVPSASIVVHVYADSDFRSLVGLATANESRPDVNAAWILDGGHGFSFTVPPAVRATGAKLFFYAISLSGTINPLITGSAWIQR